MHGRAADAVRMQRISTDRWRLQCQACGSIGPLNHHDSREPGRWPAWEAARCRGPASLHRTSDEHQPRGSRAGSARPSSRVVAAPCRRGPLGRGVGLRQHEVRRSLQPRAASWLHRIRIRSIQGKGRGGSSRRFHDSESRFSAAVPHPQIRQREQRFDRFAQQWIPRILPIALPCRIRESVR